MEAAETFLAKGIEQLNKQKYADAEKSFNEGLSKIEGKEKENLSFYCDLLIQRSLSEFHQENYDKAEEDANTVLEALKENNSDDLKRIQSLAYLRLGQIFEMRGRLLPCLREYARSAAIFPENDGQSNISRLFTEVGLPPISDAPEMAPFLKIANSILRDEELAQSLAESLKFIKKPGFDAPTFSSIGGCRIYYAVIQIYIDDPLILGICVQCLTVLAQKGSQDVWSGYPLIKTAFEKAVVNPPLFLLLVQLLQLTPPPLFEYMDKLDFIDPLCDGLTLDLTDDQTEAVMYLLFHLAGKEEQSKQIHNEGVTEICLKKRNHGSFMLLSKLCFVPEACQLAVKEGIIDWCLSILNDPKEKQKHLLLGALVLLPQTLLPENNPNIEKDGPLIYEKIVSAVYSTMMKNTKDSELISNGFATAIVCVPHVPQKIIEQKFIQAASVLLAVHNNDVKTAATILEFLFKLCQTAGADEVKKVNAVLPTAMKALSTHSSHFLVVEYGTGLAIYLGHEKRNELYKAALEILPKSELLQQMKSLLK
ncbi:hypothetical protein TRFO_10641 [Tritrichomonas foetus]|uniref:TPR Domain containing protein n=1 Tax=Tritrichomonas foetus TaxID=1144522 RepID=A0A1J4J7P6_9EUKA|nr:hypothetical protein TRFO_10641 [Tritrichomonas foetus]|eukprot:OHS95160.1 hypothetical protein TRFO_10641 [Tritrichomonas foetus]